MPTAERNLKENGARLAPAVLDAMSDGEILAVAARQKGMLNRLDDRMYTELFHSAYEKVYGDVRDSTVRFINALEYSSGPVENPALEQQWKAALARRWLRRKEKNATV